MTDQEKEPRPHGWHIRHYPDGVAVGVAFDCPGCGGDCWVPIDPVNGWAWNGSETAPSLTPSLGQRCCGWHGYLTDGRFVPC